MTLLVSLCRADLHNRVCTGRRSDHGATGARARRVWNQSAQRVTNVGEGSVPRVEPQNWSAVGLNNLRQNP
jgi:hypothetical protein